MNKYDDLPRNELIRRIELLEKENGRLHEELYNVSVDNLKLTSVMTVHKTATWEYDVVKKEFKFTDKFFHVLDVVENDSIYPTFDEFMQILHPDDVNDYSIIFNKFLAGEIDTFKIVYRVIGKEKKILWFEDSFVSYEKDYCGNTVKAIGCTMNVTDEKEQKEKLKTLEERNAKIVRAIPYLIVIFNRDLEVKEILAAPYDDDEYRIWKFIGSKTSSLDVLVKLREQVNTCLLSNALQETDCWLEDVNKNMGHYYRVRMVPFTDSEVLCFIHNIDLRMQQTRALKENHTKLSLAMKAGNLIPWIIDIERRMIRFEDDLLNRELPIADFVKIVHSKDKLKMIRSLRRLYNNTASQANIEIRINMFGEQYEWYILYGIVFEKNEQGIPVKLIGCGTNINERKRIEQELLESKLRAEEADKLKSTFLANMSHEIRTPLNAIVGFSELVGNTDDQEERDSYLEIIRTNNGLLLQLINDILDLSRMESGRIEMSFQEVNLNELLFEIRQVHQLKIKNNVALRLECPAQIVHVLTDKNRVTQVISNFLSNAMKNTVQGSITLGFTLGDVVRIFVKDTGVGIPPEKLVSVFERFTKLNDFVQGTGLGLSICKTIVEKLGGNIAVESIVGEGTTFSFTLPLEEKEFGTSTSSTTTSSFSMSTSSQTNVVVKSNKNLNKQQTLLVAEDVETNFLLLQAILKNQYNLVHAVNGREAVEMYDAYQPDLILMDIKMPLLDGIEATIQIRKKCAEVPIFAVTAHAFDSEQQAATDAGCDEIISKPFNPKQLKNKIKEYLS